MILHLLWINIYCCFNFIVYLCLIIVFTCKFDVNFCVLLINLKTIKYNELQFSCY